MTYVLNNWVDQDVERPRTYEVTTNMDGSITLIDSFGLVTELGTPVNAVNMNHIEGGIGKLYEGLVLYDAEQTYTDKSIVGNINSSGKVELYRSLRNNNTGNPLSDTTYWQTVKLGGEDSYIGGIKYSLLPLTDSGLHLLDGALISGSGAYADFVDYIADLYTADPTASYFSQPKTTYNIVRHGTPSENSGVFGGFSASNYLTTPETFNPSSNSWEILIKFKTGNDVTTTQTIYARTDESYYGVVVLIENGKISAEVASSSSTLIGTLAGTSTLSTNAVYYAKIEFTGSQYKLSLSTDNTTYNLEASYTSSTPIFTSTNDTKFGIQTAVQVIRPFLGTIDLNGCHIKINNSLWWQGYTTLSSEQTWQLSVSTYGVCGKFVYDSVNNTVRIPKVTGFIEGTIDASALGNLVQAGLPNIAGTHTADVTAHPTGCFYETGVLQPYSSGDRSGEVIGLNASLSNPIYGRSTTVQPQSIKGFVYIVISTSAKTDIQVDIDDIATDLNGKADTDLSNISPSASGRNTIAGWSMPDFSNSIQISLPYTAPSNGYLLEQVFSSGYIDLLINGSTTFYSGLSTENATRTLMYPIKVNDVITRADSNGGWYLYFIPVKGAN